MCLRVTLDPYLSLFTNLSRIDQRLETQTYTNHWRETSGKHFKMGLCAKSCPNRTPTAQEIPHPQINKYDYKTSQQKKKSSERRQPTGRVGKKSLAATSGQGSIPRLYKELQTLTPIEQNCQPVSESMK